MKPSAEVTVILGDLRAGREGTAGWDTGGISVPVLDAMLNTNASAAMVRSALAIRDFGDASGRERCRGRFPVAAPSERRLSRAA
jgi:hypothetical protein